TSMRILSSIGLNATGLSRLLSTQLYAQFIRTKLEYGVAITSFTKTALKQIEQAQNKCIRMIYGAHKNSETKVMRHITNLPSMNERVNILQAKYIYRAKFLPEDTLFIQLLPNFNQQPSNSQWIALCKSIIWQLIEDQNRTPTTQDLKLYIRQHRVANHVSTLTAVTGSKTLAACRPKLGIDPIMWIPMSNKERSRCIRWRIGWLPGGKHKTCLTCQSHTFTKHHAIQCLQMHRRLNLNSNRTDDPLSFILNNIP
ncbi:hypothetical protein BDC45DRAFT_413535, partial [Circinella umbellata]